MVEESPKTININGTEYVKKQDENKEGKHDKFMCSKNGQPVWLDPTTVMLVTFLIEDEPETLHMADDLYKFREDEEIAIPVRKGAESFITSYGRYSIAYWEQAVKIFKAFSNHSDTSPVRVYHKYDESADEFVIDWPIVLVYGKVACIIAPRVEN